MYFSADMHSMIPDIHEEFLKIISFKSITVRYLSLNLHNWDHSLYSGIPSLHTALLYIPFSCRNLRGMLMRPFCDVS